MRNIFARRIRELNRLFAAKYIDPRMVYVHYFNRIPLMAYVDEVIPKNGYDYINTKLKNQILKVYGYYYFNHTNGRAESLETIYVLKKKRMIVQGEDFFHIFHKPGDYDWAYEVMKDLAAFRNSEAKQTIGFNRAVKA